MSCFFSLHNSPTGFGDLLKVKHLLLQELLYLKTDKTTEEIFKPHSKDFIVLELQTI